MAIKVNTNPADKTKVHFLLEWPLDLLVFFSVRLTPSIWALLVCQKNPPPKKVRATENNIRKHFYKPFRPSIQLMEKGNSSQAGHFLGLLMEIPFTWIAMR